MNRLPPRPFSEALLKRYWLRTREQIRPGLSGGHLTRRQGQSLEFREFAVYTPGDDIRHVDWRASSRYGGQHDLLIRKFVAEEQHALVISIDTRTTMTLPAELPKLHVASWLAEAIAWVALRSGDRAVLHRLFSPAPQAPVALRGATRTGQIRTAVERCQPQADSGATAGDDALNLEGLRPYLPPTAIWLILTDFYFTVEQAEVLAQHIIQAQNGFRQVLLVDLDSWPYEKTLLGTGARWIEGPGLVVERPHYEITEETLQQVESKIAAQKSHFLQLLQRSRVDSHWAWPQPPLAGAVFFQEQFANDKAIQSLFVRNTL